jgi:hypothetical protein
LARSSQLNGHRRGYDATVPLNVNERSLSDFDSPFVAVTADKITAPLMKSICDLTVVIVWI